MNTYTLFWLTGKSELVTGDDIANAMTLAGYSQGAIPALDFYSEGDKRKEYIWSSNQATWIKER